MTSYFEERMAEIRAEMAQLPPRAKPKPWMPAPTPPAEYVAKPRKKKYRPQGYVYFFRAGNVVKIGFSVNVRERQHSLQTGCSERAFMVKVLPGTVLREREMHKRFAEYRTSGEWFDLRGRLAKYLERDIHPIELPGRAVQAEPELEEQDIRL